MKISKELFKKHALREDKGTLVLIRKLKNAKKRGYLKKNEFLEICKWKSPRPIRTCMKNSEDEIKKITEMAFSIKYEKRKIDLLDRLKGVNIPMASSILTLVFPDKYGVIDVRAWNSLVRLGLIKAKKSERKRSFNKKDWYRYTMIVRHWAKKFNTTPRRIDLFLYQFDRETTEDRIYGSVNLTGLRDKV